MLDAAGIGVDSDNASIFGMGRGFRLELQFSNQLLHYNSPLELLRYEFRPGALVALDFTTVLVESKPRCLLGGKWRGRKAESLFKQLGVVAGLAADFLVVGYVKLNANPTVLRIYKQRDVIGGRTAAQCAPMIL